ncbi:replication-relaxation family protein [bacterium]|nr:replication-relaxation family protein [bacterium]
MATPRNRARAKKVVLTERDVELLVSLFKYRYLTALQVERLHFPSAQTATRRLRMLQESGFVSMFQAPGAEERIVALADGGADVVAEHLTVPKPDLGWNGSQSKPKDYYFLKHFIGVNNFRIALTAACEARTDLDLLGFIPEYLAERQEDGAIRKYIRDVVSDIRGPGKITHTPDGVFALEKAGRAALFFLEIDRGTETVSDPRRGILKHIHFYLRYLDGDGYQRYREDFGVAEPFRGFRALVVTSSPKRLENIREVGGRINFEPDHAKRFIWLASQDQVDGSDILSEIWRDLSPDGGTHAIAS